MKMTLAQYEELMRRPAIAKRNADSESPNPIPQCIAVDAPHGKAQLKEGNTGKFIVHVTSYRTVLLDEDNLVPKYHVDSLRYAGILPSDAPGRCKISITQAKVQSESQERTEITITHEP